MHNVMINNLIMATTGATPIIIALLNKLLPLMVRP